ncbi:MAG: hypothetical protein AVDCRST_MAG91-2351 [uncultured Sphingomonadaceae bacterium]|uniref:Uncharacterized protein n=1 Tax=uncultured Sphingomonadaceae bacterium TaxID=169976 RepID=A0A6J4THJ8_9SPHN|nr:MAG: hypothetical protein AVDCRST_MAG91-2351 [uncultured Sphingomonadaceae bacterium]
MVARQLAHHHKGEQPRIDVVAFTGLGERSDCRRGWEERASPERRPRGQNVGDAWQAA